MRDHLIVLLLASTCLAQDTLNVVITATQYPEMAADVPYAISTVPREELDFSRSVPDALSRLPAVSVQKTGPGQGSPFVRGLTGFHNLYLIDGIRLNNSVFRSGPNQYFGTIDPLTLDRLEVLRGPASVLYGSDALGGVFHAISRFPKLSKEGWKAGGEAYERFNSADLSTVSRLGFSLANEKLAVKGGATYRDFNDLRAGEHQGKLENTAYSEFDHDMRLVYSFTKAIEARFGFDRVTQMNVPRTHSTIYSQSYRGTKIGSRERRDLDQERDLIFAQLALTPKSGLLSAANFSLSFQRQDEIEKQLRTSKDLATNQGFTVDTFGAAARFELEPLEWLQVALGSDFYHDEVSSFRHDLDLATGAYTDVGRGPVADDATYDLFGLYTQLDLRPIDGLRLTAGARWTLAYLDANQIDYDPNDNFDFPSQRKTYEAVVGNFRARIEPVDGFAVVLGVSQGFRAPNLDDVTSFREVRSSSVDLPAPDLDPEETVSFETGVVWDTEYAKGSAFFFHTILDNMIGRIPTGNTNQGLDEFGKDNFIDGWIRGVELDGQIALWKPWGVYAKGGFAWVEGQADAYANGQIEDHVINRMQPAKGYTALRWEWDGDRYWAEARADFIRQQGRLSPRDEGDSERIPAAGTPGYTNYSLQAGLRPLEFLSVGVELDNLLDKDYRVHGSGQNGQGLSAAIWARLEF